MDKSGSGYLGHNHQKHDRSKLTKPELSRLNLERRLIVKPGKQSAHSAKHIFNPEKTCAVNNIKTRPQRRHAPKLQRFTSQVFSSLARKTRFVEPTLAEKWGEIVDNEIASICWPGRLSSGRQHRTLEIITDTGAAATRISYAQNGIIRDVNRYLGPDIVSYIKIIQTGLKKHSSTDYSNGFSEHSSAQYQAKDADEQEITSPFDAILKRFHEEN